MVKRSNEQEKTLLRIVSFIFGTPVSVLYFLEAGKDGLTIVNGAAGIILGFGASIFYAITGSVAVRIHAAVRIWVHRGQVLGLTEREKMRLAAFWPVTPVVSIFCHLFWGSSIESFEHSFSRPVFIVNFFLRVAV